ncbi:MAG: 3-deoxy-7-phosphoheptulonate synthase [Pirellulaceae bacterium]|nr:3-deoxy-7-phosphoheptulonate synthase [Pirellulaceae bacterium]
MLVVMGREATEEDIKRVVQAIEARGLAPHLMPGPTRTAIGITGNTEAVESSGLRSLPGVRDLIRVTKPYKLASREMRIDDSTIKLPQTTIGPKNFTIIAGPCSVEDEKTMHKISEYLVERGIRILRAGAFKPRTSPYSFQGKEHSGLKLLEELKKEYGLGITTELMDSTHAEALEEVADLIQIGTRNMQNFTLLKRVGQLNTPVLLKRGMSATLEEWLMAAEYILSGGNMQVAMCERGIRTFADHNRNTLDISVIPPLKRQSHLPVIVDPSHATGYRPYVKPMALASMAAGADGIIVEIHPQPEQASSDGAQSLNFEEFDDLLKFFQKMGPIFGKTID